MQKAVLKIYDNKTTVTLDLLKVYDLIVKQSLSIINQLSLGCIINADILK